MLHPYVIADGYRLHTRSSAPRQRARSPELRSLLLFSITKKLEPSTTFNFNLRARRNASLMAELSLMHA